MPKDYISEGQALSDNLDWGPSRNADEIERDYEDQLAAKINVKTRRYEAAGAAKIGDTIACSNCGKQMKKKSYQSKFCSNRGRKNCKDSYWNIVDDLRRGRAQVRKSGSTAYQKIDRIHDRDEREF